MSTLILIAVFVSMLTLAVVGLGILVQTIKSLVPALSESPAKDKSLAVTYRNGDKKTKIRAVPYVA